MRKKRLLKRIAIPLLLLLVSIFTFAQNKVISGKVVDSKDGTPISGVSVVPKGSTSGTTTGADGTFQITIGQKTTVLVFSYIGFATQQIPVGLVNMRVALTASNTTLNEVVVVGYGTVKKKELTGSIAVVTAKDFQQGAITTPEQMIAGKAAGVSITSNGGSPGQAA